MKKKRDLLIYQHGRYSSPIECDEVCVDGTTIMNRCIFFCVSGTAGIEASRIRGAKVEIRTGQKNGAREGAEKKGNY